jgi:hypothetical protein
VNEQREAEAQTHEQEVCRVRVRSHGGARVYRWAQVEMLRDALRDARRDWAAQQQREGTVGATVQNGLGHTFRRVR